jgi:hypothetical protein
LEGLKVRTLKVDGMRRREISPSGRNDGRGWDGGEERGTEVGALEKQRKEWRGELATTGAKRRWRSELAPTRENPRR